VQIIAYQDQTGDQDLDDSFVVEELSNHLCAQEDHEDHGKELNLEPMVCSILSCDVGLDNEDSKGDLSCRTSFVDHNGRVVHIQGERCGTKDVDFDSALDVVHNMDGTEVVLVDSIHYMDGDCKDVVVVDSMDVCHHAYLLDHIFCSLVDAIHDRDHVLGMDHLACISIDCVAHSKTHIFFYLSSFPLVFCKKISSYLAC
jgi:hypothetical protein